MKKLAKSNLSFWKEANIQKNTGTMKKTIDTYKNVLIIVENVKT